MQTILKCLQSILKREHINTVKTIGNIKVFNRIINKSDKEVRVGTDCVSVTEIAGDEVTQEQVDRLCNRYYWAGRYCLDKDVVEAACGTGQGLGYLHKITRSLEAGDYSEKILSIARKHYRDRIVLLQFDAQNMPFVDQSKDVIILFEAIYYLPDVERFVCECKRVLRPGGKVLIATANKDLYDFNPSPRSYIYYGVIELKSLFEKYGFRTEFFGGTPIDNVSIRQKVLRPIKKLAVILNIMPKTTSGKKWLKRLVFGNLVKMPTEIGPQITPVPSTGFNPGFPRGATGQAQIAQNEKNEKTSDRAPYVEPDRIPSDVANTSHKVIYCVATLDPQITQINAD